MLFSSIEFFVLVAVVLLMMAVLRVESHRRTTLLVASYVFYGWWNWTYCLLILASTAIDFVAAIQIEEAARSRRKRAWLVLSLATNLGLLGFFKYFGFLTESLGPVFRLIDRQPVSLDILLPVGISFFTFQSMSYTIDVYRGRLATTRDFRDFALFVSFFPQLVAGPIVRASDFLPQLEVEHPLRASRVREGAEIFLRGFFKKVLCADTLAIMVDHVFKSPESFSSLSCWVAIVAYSGQIYYDFSGYSDMAIGTARMLGFDLPENFRHPYLSTSITEFWRRWHISLSSWLRDYLYIPLGGNREGRYRTYLNLMITMLLGGLWHGASWTFVAWGGLHGIGLALERVRGRDSSPRVTPRWSLRGCLAWLGTFVFIQVTWVFFRSRDFSTAWTFLTKMAFVGSKGIDWLYLGAVMVILLGATLHLATWLRDEEPLRLDLRRPLDAVVAMSAVLVILLFSPQGHSPFIYFQF